MIGAIILAAGMSTRMGQPKMLMPWGDSTVIRTVVECVLLGGISECWVVTGSLEAEIKRDLTGLSMHYAHNPDFSNGQMLASVKLGLKSLSKEIEAALIVLGDQPQVESRVIGLIVERYRSNQRELIVPSYQMRRGHPWLVGRSLWNDILKVEPPETLREFLNSKQQDIDYLAVDTPSILLDLDTQDDYAKHKP
jgi:molybdenum cofactor cytidylyltransferase